VLGQDRAARHRLLAWQSRILSFEPRPRGRRAVPRPDGYRRLCGAGHRARRLFRVAPPPRAFQQVTIVDGWVSLRSSSWPASCVSGEPLPPAGDHPSPARPRHPFLEHRGRRSRLGIRGRCDTRGAVTRRPVLSRVLPDRLHRAGAADAQAPQPVGTTTWLDGAVAGLGAAALCACFAFNTVLHSVGGDASAVATDLAYPIGDGLLLILAWVAPPSSPAGRKTQWLLIRRCNCDDCRRRYVQPVRESGTTSHVGSIFNSVAWPCAILLISIAVWVHPLQKSPLAIGETPGFLLPGLGPPRGSRFSWLTRCIR